MDWIMVYYYAKCIIRTIEMYTSFVIAHLYVVLLVHTVTPAYCPILRFGKKGVNEVNYYLFGKPRAELLYYNKC